MWIRLLAALILTALTVSADAGFFPLFTTYSYTILTPCSATVTLSPGAVTANTLAPSCLANPADTVASNSTWTASPANYITANASAATYIASTLSSGIGRDITVKTWMRQGYVYERLDTSGNAIYFYHDGSHAGGNGYLEIGIVTGLGATTNTGGTPYPLYENNDLVHTFGSGGSVCNGNYTTTATDGQHFIFGVSGFNITVGYSSSGSDVSCVSFLEYRQMNNGGVALAATSLANNGFRDITITGLSPSNLYSHYWQSQLDLRDWNLRSIQTTGSISQGSTCLTVASPAGFQLNDWVIVEIGHEAGVGARGTIGVGGQWPTQTYTTHAQLEADTSQPTNTFGWEQNDGVVYQWTGSAWITNFNTDTWYTAEAIPQSLHGKITAIGSCNGASSLTLSISVPSTGTFAGEAAATATNANVYLDNQPYVNYLTGEQKSTSGFYADLTPITPTNETIIFPSGSYAASGLFVIESQNGWVITGQGQTNTTLFCPKGVYSLGFSMRVNKNGFTIQNLKLVGNWAPTQFGMRSAGWTFVPGGLTASGGLPYNADGDDSAAWLTDTADPQQGVYPFGISFNSSPNGIVQNVTVNEVSQFAVQSSFSDNVFAYNVTNNQTQPFEHYIQWQFEWANNQTSGGCIGCTLNSTYLIGGFELFENLNGVYTNTTSTNGTFSLNDAGAYTISNTSITITSNSAVSDPAWNPSNSIMEIDTNIGSGYAASGGTFTNTTIVVQGGINANNDIPKGFDVNSNNPNITINGGSYTAPNWSSPSTLPGPWGIGSTGTGTSVNNFASCGSLKAASGVFNIYLQGAGSSLTNSQATTFSPTGTGNTTC